MWAVTKPLRPHPLSVGQARNFCTSRLTSVLQSRGDVGDVVADAAMIASELVTNAVSAGSSQIELSIALHGSSVHIEVADNAAGAPATASPSTTDTSGRGLLVVAALSREWGVASAGSTKSVWAEVGLSGSSGAA